MVHLGNLSVELWPKYVLFFLIFWLNLLSDPHVLVAINLGDTFLSNNLFFVLLFDYLFAHILSVGSLLLGVGSLLLGVGSHRATKM